jgi:hypothetical protein
MSIETWLFLTLYRNRIGVSVRLAEATCGFSHSHLVDGMERVEDVLSVNMYECMLHETWETNVVDSCGLL